MKATYIIIECPPLGSGLLKSFLRHFKAQFVEVEPKTHSELAATLESLVHSVEQFYEADV